MNMLESRRPKDEPRRHPAPDVRALIAPSTVAVVGASDDPARIGGRPLDYMRRFGFGGDLWGVNPKYRTVQGIPCVASIDQLPPDIDLFVFAVPAALVPEMLRSVGDRGGRAVSVFAGGFAETDGTGKALQEEITQVARQHGIALNGPNCLGVISFAHKNFATFSTALTSLNDFSAGEVAIVSQSGGFATNLCVEAGLRGAAFSHVITTGNEAGLDFADYLDFLADDPSTKTVMGYLEGVRNGARLSASLQRLNDARKPVFLTKVGRTATGAGVVATHTALSSGADSSFDALFRRFGVRRLHTIDEMVDVARAHSHGTPDQGGLVVATISGGTAAYIADCCESLGIELPDLSEETRAALSRQVPEFGFLRNPVDLTAQLVNDLPSLGRALDTLDADKRTRRILLFLGGQESHSSAIIGQLLETSAQARGRLSVSWLGIPEDIRRTARAQGLDVHGDPVRFLRGLAATSQVTRPTSLTKTTCLPPLDEAMAATPLDFVEASGRRALDEWLTLDLLSRAELPVPDRARVSDLEPLSRAAESVGFPCVLKMLRPFVAHRSRIGAVVVGIESPDALQCAWEEMQTAHQAEAAVVEAQSPPGLEVIVGVMADASFGARMSISAGGVRVDDISQRVTLIPPFEPELIEDEISNLDVWEAATLAGSSPEEACALVSRTAARIAHVFLALRHELDEIECNPVIVHAHGATIVDALAFGKDVDKP